MASNPRVTKFKINWDNNNGVAANNGAVINGTAGDNGAGNIPPPAVFAAAASH